MVRQSLKGWGMSDELEEVLMVQTDKRTFYISVTAELDEDGSLVKFFDASELVLAIPREQFMWVEKVAKPSKREEPTK